MQPAALKVSETATPLREKADLGSERLPRNPADLFDKWKTSKHPGDFQAVVRSLDPAINRGLNAFGGNKQHLKTRARLIAADAVRTYDPTKSKATLPTWVYGHLQRLQRVAADRDAAVRMPERVRMDAITARDAENVLRDKFGHEPDIQSLAEATGLSKSRLKASRNAYREVSESGLLSDKGDSLGTQNAKEDKDSPPDPWVDYIYYDLDPKSRVIFERVTGYGGKDVWQKKQIAKELGITPAAVSHRIGGILQRLRERPPGNIT